MWLFPWVSKQPFGQLSVPIWWGAAALPASPWLKRWLLPILLLSLVGCNSTGGLSQKDYDRAKKVLERALSAWKKGESAKKWSRKEAPIRMVDDDWLKGYRLMDFQIVRLKANVDRYPEAIVTLTLQPSKGPAIRREALYGINITQPNQAIIGRDPMH